LALAQALDQERGELGGLLLSAAVALVQQAADERRVGLAPALVLLVGAHEPHPVGGASSGRSIASSACSRSSRSPCSLSRMASSSPLGAAERRTCAGMASSSARRASTLAKVAAFAVNWPRARSSASARAALTVWRKAGSARRRVRVRSEIPPAAAAWARV